MKTDRELLELSAKAAGYKLHIWGTEGAENVARMDTLSPTKWNPITDDGDALRLAVKLDITLYQYGHEVSACNERGTVNESVEKVGDPHAATRRAIVRAAVAIGEAM